MGLERKIARNWYWWLWLSPLLTIPTIIFVSNAGIGHEVICGGPGRCDWDLAERANLIVGILLASLWHLVLLKPVSEKERTFVHWHGLQAFCLAGIRTAVPLAFVIVFGFDYPALFSIPILIIIWFIGTLIGQDQAVHGKCSLSRWAGQGDELAKYRKLKSKRTPEYEKIGFGYPERSIHIIRFSNDPEKRRKALADLKSWDMVEDF